MQRNYLVVWLTLGALLIAVLLAIGSAVEPPPLPSAPAPGRVSVTLAWDNLREQLSPIRQWF